jgi:hypothetical protein
MAEIFAAGRPGGSPLRSGCCSTGAATGRWTGCCSIGLRRFWSNPDQSARDDIVSVVKRLDVSRVGPRLVAMLGLVERGAVV